MAIDTIRRFFIAVWVILMMTLACHQLLFQEILPVSPYDSRGFSLEKQVRRGGIYDRRGELLANTPNPEGVRHLVGSSYVHTVGYHLEDVGETGLELRYSRELSGVDSMGDISRIIAKVKGTAAVGADLMTTLDRRWQRAAVKALGLRKGAVIVLDPYQGEVLAMVSQPGFEPSQLRRGTQVFKDINAPLVNRATSGLYPPGSLFKVIAASAAYRYGYDKAEFICDGFIPANGHIIHDAEKKPHGRIGLNKALSVSCNSYFVQLGRTIGAKRLIAEARRWGFGVPPSFDIPVQSGRLPHNFQDVSDFAAFSIGQGALLTTPLHVARAYGIIAADGKLPPLRLVSGVRYSWCNEIKSTLRPPSPRVIPKDRAARLYDGLRGVVTDGTGRRSELAEVIVAGKTGTAETGESTASHAWFAAIGEYQGKRRVVVVLVEHGGSGGRVAAPVVRDILKSAQRGEYW